MYGYIYECFNTFTNEFYIGQKKSSVFDPNYLGSGINQKLNIEKYGKDSFCVIMLDSAESQQELDELEKKYISEYKNIHNEKCINQAAGGIGGNVFLYADEETKNNFVDKMKVINKQRCSTEDFKEKCRNNMNTRYSDTLEREKQSQRLKETYKNNPEFGIKRSESLKEYYKNHTISESIILANQKKCCLDLNDIHITFDCIGDLKSYLKSEFDFNPDNKTFNRLINTGDEYIPFRKSEKFQKLNGLKISLL